jgi:hypothetical protein
MKIKYNRAIPIFFICLSTFMGISFYYFQQKGIKVDENMKWIVPMVFLLSIPMLFVNYIVITDREIIVNNQFGMVSRRYAINNKSEISMVGNRIFLDKPSKKEEVKFKKLYASKKGLRELNAQLNHFQ